MPGNKQVKTEALAVLVALGPGSYAVCDGQGSPRRQAFRTVGVVVKRLCGIVPLGEWRRELCR